MRAEGRYFPLPLRPVPVFYALLLITFGIALAVSVGVARAFDRPIGAILARIIADEISAGWQKYVRFAIYVVGISGGVRIYQLERYLEPGLVRPGEAAPTGPPPLTAERWVLEVYRTVIEALQSIAWMLLVFFAFALVAYVVVRLGELRAGRRAEPPGA